MLKAKKKIRQKELKQDKLVTSYFQAREWVTKEENKKKLYLIGGIIVVLIAVMFYWISNKKAMNEEAELKFSSVINLYQANQFNEAINGDPANGITGLLDIVNNYGSTDAGETAKLYLANSYYNIRDYDNALKYFEDYSGDEEIIEASCISGIGAVYEARNDFKTAAEYYERSTKVEKDIVINQENLFYAIKAYNQAGDKQNAQKLFDQLRINFPKSKYIAEVKKFESDFKL